VTTQVPVRLQPAKRKVVSHNSRTTWTTSRQYFFLVGLNLARLPESYLPVQTHGGCCSADDQHRLLQLLFTKVKIIMNLPSFNHASSTKRNLLNLSSCNRAKHYAYADCCDIPGPCNIPRSFDFGPPPDEIDGPAEFLDRFNFDHLDRCGIGP
jgi:hypothetical protein